MSAFGGISTVVLASSRKGGILLERMYDAGLAEHKEAVLRDFVQSAELEGLICAAEDASIQQQTESQAFTSLYKKHNLVFQKIPDSDVILFCSGNLDQNHARVANVIECFLSCLVEVLNKKSVTEDRIIKNYSKVCLLLDEILNEGIVKTLDTRTILKQLKV
jgi:hypothetical protein